MQILGNFLILCFPVLRKIHTLRKSLILYCAIARINSTAIHVALLYNIFFAVIIMTTWPLIIVIIVIIEEIQLSNNNYRYH